MFYFQKAHVPVTFRHYLISDFTKFVFIITTVAYKANELWSTSDITPLHLLRTIVCVLD